MKHIRDTMRLRLAQKGLGYQMIGRLALQEVIAFLACTEDAVLGKLKRGKKLFLTFRDTNPQYLIQISSQKKELLSRINRQLAILGYRQKVEDIIIL